MLTAIVITVNWAILWYFIILSFAYIILLVASIKDVFFRFAEVEVGDTVTLAHSNTLPPVTVVMPAYNEEEHILDTVAAVLRSDYPNAYCIVVNDGSTDRTLDKLISAFDLYNVGSVVPRLIKTTDTIRGYYISRSHPHLVVIDKEHTERSDNMNIGVNACRTPLFMTVDADTLIEPDAISRIVFAMLTQSHAVAVGGAVYILNGCEFKNGIITEPRMSRQFLYGFQACEYLRSFLFSRSGWNAMGGALCYAGAFMLLEHKAVIEIGGYDLNNPAQDFEIITHLHKHQRLHKYPYKIFYTAAAAAWTDVPGTLKGFWRQRINWQRGMLRSLMLHRSMLFNPRYGIVGFYTYPFFLLGETLGPVVECIAYLSILASWALGIIDWHWVLLLILIAWGLAMFLSMATALMNFLTYDRYRRLSDLFWMFLIVIIEMFGFRQYQAICRTVGTIKYLLSKEKPHKPADPDKPKPTTLR